MIANSIVRLLPQYFTAMGKITITPAPTKISYFYLLNTTISFIQFQIHNFSQLSAVPHINDFFFSYFTIEHLTSSFLFILCCILKKFLLQKKSPHSMKSIFFQSTNLCLRNPDHISHFHLGFSLKKA